jgi:fluoride exporter
MLAGVDDQDGRRRIDACQCIKVLGAPRRRRIRRMPRDRPGAERPPPTPETATLPGRGARATDLRVLAAVAAGGAMGTVARHAIALAVDQPPGVFPLATFGVNATGSFALGVVLVVLLERGPPRRLLRLPFLATGVLGAFTTYSTFAVQADLLVRDGRPALALTYVAGSLGAGLCGAWLGILTGRSTVVRPGGHARGRSGGHAGRREGTSGGTRRATTAGSDSGREEEGT